MSALAVTDAPKARRGTSNTNARGSSYERRRRREWLVDTFASDMLLIRVEWESGEVTYCSPELSVRDLRELSVVVSAEQVKTCRCYRCGCLLTVDTVTVDRIIPGCHGGTYRRSNIRPVCGKCNSETGAVLRRKK